MSMSPSEGETGGEMSRVALGIARTLFLVLAGFMLGAHVPYAVGRLRRAFATGYPSDSNLGLGFARLLAVLFSADHGILTGPRFWHRPLPAWFCYTSAIACSAGACFSPSRLLLLHRQLPGLGWTLFVRQSLFCVPDARFRYRSRPRRLTDLRERGGARRA